MIVALLLMVAMPMMAERVSPETARKVAQTFLNNNGAKSTQLTDLSKAAGFANLYIFNGEEGFVVMAADDCVQPILGYSLTGKFVAEGMPENVHDWLQGYSDEIQYAVDSKMEAAAENAKMWKDLAEGNAKAGRTSVVVGPLTQTLWDQTQYYNIYCPAVSDGPSGRAYTGCVATAMAQIMKYWGYPLQGTGTHSYTWNSQTLSADFGSTSYDWENMTNAYSSSSTDEQIQAVSTLMYHCGVSVDMNYGGQSTGGSAASTAQVGEALKTYFNYSSGIVYKSKEDYPNDWEAMVKSELDENRPLQYRGSSSRGGHSFVCDGYNSNNYFHFNWGWSGNYDGYFSLDNLNTGANNQSGQGNGTYTNDQAALFCIEPISSLSAPVLQTSTSEGVITLTWNAVEGAISYDLYKNFVKVANGLETTTYSDDDITFGTEYEYYVRAVSSETTSNPSNVVKINSTYRVLNPTNLSATLTNNNIALNWMGYTGNLSTDLHYATEITGYVYGTGETETYWGERFASEIMSDFCGMTITRISCPFYYASTYSLYVYNGGLVESDKIAEQSFTKSSTGIEWKNFSFSAPLTIDCSKDLWIVLYNNDANIAYPALEGEYSGDNQSEANYMSSSLSDLHDHHSSSSSWLSRTYLTDGTYTYNLYDGTTTVASNINATNYTVSNVTDNAAHQYTVKTNYYGGESAASNMAGLTLGTASLSSLELGENDKMTVTEGSKLTVGGTLTNTNPANLILENGAELVHNFASVKATVKKTIQPYTEGHNDGWNLIASPVIEDLEAEDVSGLLRNEYDLYTFDPSGTDNNGNATEWRNYRADAFTVIKHKVGYLYANSEETTLTFAGTLAGIAEATELSLNAGTNFAGFNLIGNPYPCNAYANKPFYVLQYNQEEDNTSFVLGNNPIPPCSAILVQAQNDGETVSFSKTPIAEPSSIVMHLSEQKLRSNTALDEARINFEEQRQLTKYTWGKAASTIYIPQNGQNFAVAYANGENKMPLNFKAAKNGTYTLAFEVENLDLDYLHLIDNMTGNEIDVLAMPAYTFEAKTSDYASRFKLVFAEPTDGPSADDQPFAYYANGEIRIVADVCDASLQVVDMTGRVVASVDGHTRCVPTTGMVPGIYVLRLINGDTVRTQKIVIE